MKWPTIKDKSIDNEKNELEPIKEIDNNENKNNQDNIELSMDKKINTDELKWPTIKDKSIDNEKNELASPTIKDDTPEIKTKNNDLNNKEFSSEINPDDFEMPDL